MNSSVLSFEEHAKQMTVKERIKQKRNSWAILEEQGESFCTFMRWSKTAQFQMGWLLICVSTFIIVGAYELLIAIENETASYKPLKVVSSTDYSELSSVQYEMPYVYIIFRVNAPESRGENGNYWTNETISYTLNNMLETVDFLNTSIEMGYDYKWNHSWIPSHWEEASVVLLGTFTHSAADEIVACFKLKPASPDPNLGSFMLRFSILKNHMTLWDTLDITQVRLSLSRDGPSENYLDHVPLQVDEWEDGYGLSFSYKGTVVKTVNPSSTTHFFTNTGRTYWDPENGTVEIVILPDLYVPEWSEYVEFGYTDWLGMMGGFFSLLSVTFLLGSKYLIAKCVEDPLLGILPIVSFPYSNRQLILMLKSMLEDVENDVWSLGIAATNKGVTKGQSKRMAL